MSKSKLEILLEAIEGGYNYSALADAYHSYMEERKSIPQAGQEIEVRDNERQDWINKRFIGFTKNGEVVTENEVGYVGTWKHYRIPTPKKKWKVVKDSYGYRLIFPFDHPTDLPIITTFED